MLSLLLSFLLLAAGSAEPGDREQWVQRGAEVVAPFKSSLQSALKKGLAEGGPQAISVCRDQAPALAREAGSATVRVGRTSHKVRNPANTPEPWMEPLLAAYRETPDSRDARVVQLENGGVGYVEPIYLQAACVMCHGTSIAAPVRASIAELYPEDEATGFLSGEFRGMFWVEFTPAARD
jgi:hypothetical protein